MYGPRLVSYIFFKISDFISSTTIDSFFVHKDYLRIPPLTTDTTLLNYNTIFTDRTSNNSLTSSFVNTQETLIGTRNLAPKDTKTQSPL